MNSFNLSKIKLNVVSRIHHKLNKTLFIIEIPYGKANFHLKYKNLPTIVNLRPKFLHFGDWH